MAANCLLGLLPFCPGALGIAQPHYRKIRSRELASRDNANCNRRERYSRSIQSEVGCGYQRGATFVVPHIFPLDEGAPDTQHGRDEVGSALSSARLPMQREAAWPMLC